MAPRQPKCFTQFGQGVRPVHELSQPRPRVFAGPLVETHRCDELVAPFSQSKDVLGFLGRVAQDLADRENVTLENLLLDFRVAPHFLEQLVVRNQTAGVVHQVTQDIECLRFQLDTLLIPGRVQSQ